MSADRALVKKRITMLLENNPYPHDVRVRHEAESLARAGHHVTVVAPRARGQSRQESVDGVQVRRFRLPVVGSSRGGFMLEYLVAAIALHLGALRALIGGGTVLTLHNPPDILFPAGALFRATGRQVVFDHHDLFPETVQIKFGRGWPVRLASACERLTFAVATHVIATNHSYVEIALTRGHKAPRDVTIVRNGPPEAWLQRPTRLRDGVLGHLKLVYLGTLAEQDGVEGIAPVLARLAGEIDVHLTIVGDGSARPAIEAALADHGVSDRATFTGWVPPEAVPDLIQAADICVDPTPPTDVNQRSTMIKVAEYMALGKPVVGYDLLETRRTAGDAACLVDAGNSEAFAAALLRLARDPATRLELAARARARAHELSWANSERALLDVYDGLDQWRR